MGYIQETEVIFRCSEDISVLYCTRVCYKEAGGFTVRLETHGHGCYFTCSTFLLRKNNVPNVLYHHTSVYLRHVYLGTYDIHDNYIYLFHHTFTIQCVSDNSSKQRHQYTMVDENVWVTNFLLKKKINNKYRNMWIGTSFKQYSSFRRCV